MSGEHSDHGNTPAAWTLTVLISIGFLVATTALVLGSWIWFWVGVAIVALGGIVGGVMRAAGLGQPRAASSSR